MERSPYPTSGRRGCQCKDGTYSSKCCDGESQGIGGLTGGSVSYYNFVDGSEDVNNINGLIDLSCNNINLEGFSITAKGVITSPNTNVGTITSISPASFDMVTIDTPRTLSVSITVPSGYSNSTQTIVCTTTAIQPKEIFPSLECSDITITGFAVSYDGVITLPTIDIGTIESTSPASFDDPEEDTLRTLNVNITVPSEYSNEGSILACTTTAIQVGEASTLACEDLVFTGLAVDFIGNITTPTVNIGTVSSISPTTFARSPVFTPTSRTVTVNVTVPSGYTNSGQTLACSQTVSQEVAKTFWAKDASNLGDDRYTYPDTSTSAACSRVLGINSGYLQLIHNGDNNIPVLTDDFYVYRLNGWKQFPKTVNGVTDFPDVLTLGYPTPNNLLTYSACILTDPSTLTGFITADFWMEHTYNLIPKIGVTAIGTCP